ncbi:SDR family oxidoreductase [Cochlodiniinecator piscidefendens]|uniref:SDR family oxidoreductase n=1 Tax=Cochlodiniinecator piscidefendens TaxID=2715756 RepID=UPI00140B1CD2|nr:SDR family oxidoreductase [Cochlodiniinecator piscidefendens]
MQDFTGKTVLITGASRGIGEAAARAFANAGANVVLMARSQEAIANLALEIGDHVLAVPGDVSRHNDVVNAVNAAVSKFGGLDILINNAGVIDPIEMMRSSDPEEWGRVMDINIKGVYYGMRAALPVMEAAGAGTIITISSGAAHNALEGWSAYCTSKAGAAMLTKCGHKESGSRGVRIMGLSPGTVATQMQLDIKASGINPVSQLDWDVHVPADWPARALLWMCGADADGYLGEEVSLRDEEIREKVGLI